MKRHEVAMRAYVKFSIVASEMHGIRLNLWWISSEYTLWWVKLSQKPNLTKTKPWKSNRIQLTKYIYKFTSHIQRHEHTLKFTVASVMQMNQWTPILSFTQHLYYFSSFIFGWCSHNVDIGPFIHAFCFHFITNDNEKMWPCTLTIYGIVSIEPFEKRVKNTPNHIGNRCKNAFLYIQSRTIHA